MPDRGLMEASQVHAVRLGSDGELRLERAAWLQVTFEVERAAALEHLPCEVGKPIPPYGRLLVATSDSANLAVLSVGGRFRMMPRNIVVNAVTDAPEQFAPTFGMGTMAGTISLRRGDAEVSASVSANGVELASVALPGIYAIEPSMLRWDALVAMGHVDGSAVLAEVTPEHVLTAAFLSKGATVVPSPGLPRDHAWRRLRSLGVISACYAEGTLVFGAPANAQIWT